MANATVRWNGDNLAQVERLLRLHDASAYKHGDILHITGEGLYVTLNLGDRLIIEGNRLGVQRPATKEADPEVTWDGDNVYEMSRFLSGYEVRCELYGRTVYIHDLLGREKPARLDPGDKLINRDGTLIVSKAGRDHLIQ